VIEDVMESLESLEILWELNTPKETSIPNYSDNAESRTISYTP